MAFHLFDRSGSQEGDWFDLFLTSTGSPANELSFPKGFQFEQNDHDQKTKLGEFDGVQTQQSQNPDEFELDFEQHLNLQQETEGEGGSKKDVWEGAPGCKLEIDAHGQIRMMGGGHGREPEPDCSSDNRRQRYFDWEEDDINDFAPYSVGSSKQGTSFTFVKPTPMKTKMRTINARSSTMTSDAFQTATAATSSSSSKQVPKMKVANTGMGLRLGGGLGATAVPSLGIRKPGSGVGHGAESSKYVRKIKAEKQIQLSIQETESEREPVMLETTQRSKSMESSTSKTTVASTISTSNSKTNENNASQVGTRWSEVEDVILTGVHMDVYFHRHSLKPSMQERAEARENNLPAETLVWKVIASRYETARKRFKLMTKKNIPFRTQRAIQKRWKMTASKAPLKACDDMKETLKSKQHYRIWNDVFNANGLLTCSEEMFQQTLNQRNNKKKEEILEAR